MPTSFLQRCSITMYLNMSLWWGFSWSDCVKRIFIYMYIFFSPWIKNIGKREPMKSSYAARSAIPPFVLSWSVPDNYFVYEQPSTISLVYLSYTKYYQNVYFIVLVRNACRNPLLQFAQEPFSGDPPVVSSHGTIFYRNFSPLHKS